ncbi:MAG: SUMF1/EgtB/PvdO family nonheme iron enzyme [Pirellulales bacterium]
MKTVLATLAVVLAPLSVQAVTIDTVLIGNPSNAPDLQPQGLFGRVTTTYRIGVTEVTNAQYTEFLNAVAATDLYGLYDSFMGSLSIHGGILRSGSQGSYTYDVKPTVSGGGPGGADYSYGDKPVVFVTWYDSIRFVNWLHNGQASGDTETGAYTLLGGTPTPSNANSIARNSDAEWFLPTENEWYKAAYYDASSSSYFDYPTGSDTAPNNNLPSADTGNSANFLVGSNITTGDLDYPYTPVGAYTLSDSAYGTFDQAGSVWEWNQTLFSAGVRGRRGGAWNSNSTTLGAPNQASHNAMFATDSLGFRVASVQEPDGLAGDFNNDGSVDAADYVVWRKDSGTPAEYNDWWSNFGMTAPGGGSSAAAAVPEPATLLLLLCTSVAILFKRRFSAVTDDAAL